MYNNKRLIPKEINIYIYIYMSQDIQNIFIEKNFKSFIDVSYHQNPLKYFLTQMKSFRVEKFIFLKSDESFN